MEQGMNLLSFIEDYLSDNESGMKNGSVENLLRRSITAAFTSFMRL
nr:hypothetical protein [Methanofollis formosanus]